MAVNIQSKSGRKSLKPRREPYWSRVTAGLFVGFRVLPSGEGTWIARKRTEEGKQRYNALGSGLEYDEAAMQAQKWAASLDRGIEDFGGTVEACCKEYVTYIKQHKTEATAKDAEGRFNRLVYDTPFGRIRLDKLKPTQVRDWLNKQIPDSDAETVRKAKDSANRNLSTLKAALNRALKDRLIDSDAGWRTVEKFRDVGKRRDRFLTKKERRAIMDKADPDIADLIRAMLYTFARPGELATANVADFDAKQGTLKLSGKTGTRTVTLSTAAVKFFKQQSKGKLPGAPLLARADGGRWTKESWKGPFREAAKGAGLPDEIVLYHIRHAAISEGIGAGMDSFLVAKLAGTSTAMIDKHYGHLRHDVTRSALDAVKVL